MKNFNILGVHWKIWLLGGSSQKTNIKGRLPEKEGLGQPTDLRGAWLERGGGVFEGVGGLIPWCTLCYITSKVSKRNQRKMLIYINIPKKHQIKYWLKVTQVMIAYLHEFEFLSSFAFIKAGEKKFCSVLTLPKDAWGPKGGLRDHEDFWVLGLFHHLSR